MAVPSAIISGSGSIASQPAASSGSAMRRKTCCSSKVGLGQASPVLVTEERCSSRAEVALEAAGWCRACVSPSSVAAALRAFAHVSDSMRSPGASTREARRSIWAAASRPGAEVEWDGARCETLPLLLHDRLPPHPGLAPESLSVRAVEASASAPPDAELQAPPWPSREAMTLAAAAALMVIACDEVSRQGWPAGHVPGRSSSVVAPPAAPIWPRARFLDCAGDGSRMIGGMQGGVIARSAERDTGRSAAPVLAGASSSGAASVAAGRLPDDATPRASSGAMAVAASLRMRSRTRAPSSPPSARERRPSWSR